MSIKIGDKIRYIATSEDGEVVGASELSPGCVSVRFGESFEYFIERDKLSLIASLLPRIPVIHRWNLGRLTINERWLPCDAVWWPAHSRDVK
jgi:hypothetical protein